MGLDLRTYALKVLDIAKGNVAADGYLVSAAFLVLPSEVESMEVTFSTPEEAEAAYRRVIERARQRHALAIVTVNGARFGDKVATEYLAGFPEPRKSESAPNCIWITVSGPAIPTWELLLPYVRTPHGTVFGQLQEATGVELSLLDFWASDSSKAS